MNLDFFIFGLLILDEETQLIPSSFSGGRPTQKGGWPDEAWYVHICMRGGKLQLDPKCGNMVCTLIHELLHALGLKHPEHNEALRCVNKIPGCENTPQKGPGWKEGKQ